MSDSSGIAVGTIVAEKYEIAEAVGRGAMGSVYRARQLALDKIVALKVLHPELRMQPEYCDRFMTEAFAASRLDHPNTTRILDYGEDEDAGLYIAMEFIEGRSLLDVSFENFPLTSERVVNIMSQTLSAAAAAHAIGVIHRDLKPENILIVAGKNEDDQPIDIVKVCDFGIAKIEATPGNSAPASQAAPSVRRAPTKTRAGMIVGTPEYMSPEQAQALPLDARSDLYSLGVVLYELLTGRLPFEGESAFLIAMKHVQAEPPAPSMLRPSVDARLEAICLRALKKSPDDRYASAREMRAEIRAVDADARASSFVPSAALTSAFTPTQPEAPAVRPVRKSTRSALEVSTVPVTAPAPNRRLVAWAALGVLTLAGAFWFASRGHRDLSPTPLVVASQNAALKPVDDPKTVIPPISSAVVSDPPVPTTTSTSVTKPSRPIAMAAPVTATSVVAPPIASEVPPPLPSATAEPVVAPMPSQTAAAPIVAPPPPFNPAAARIEIGRITPDRVTSRSISDALKHADFSSCYQSALRRRGSPQGGAATLSLDIDDGRIARASVKGVDVDPSFAPCISSQLVGARIDNADTGGAGALVSLTLVAQ